MFEEAFQQVQHIAEDLYDHVIRRWGNIPFAQSSVYDFVWSDEFLSVCHHLDDVEKGQIRILILQHFRVKPWPWYPRSISDSPFER